MSSTEARPQYQGITEYIPAPLSRYMTVLSSEMTGWTKTEFRIPRNKHVVYRHPSTLKISVSLVNLFPNFLQNCAGFSVQNLAHHVAVFPHVFVTALQPPDFVGVMQQGRASCPVDLFYPGGAGSRNPVDGGACREQLAVFITLQEQTTALHALELIFRRHWNRVTALHFLI